ncbi:MAG: hypothetical protein NW218_12190 [Saprospiraceae bacterium]|nr:hypothetical protein [Saprospiraceae bacterium]
MKRNKLIPHLHHRPDENRPCIDGTVAVASICYVCAFVIEKQVSFLSSKIVFFDFCCNFVLKLVKNLTSFMTDTLLYQSVLQKLGQLNPNNLSQLDAFLSVLIGHNTASQTEMMPIIDSKSPIDWLKQLAAIGGVSSIEDPVEWQRSIREDRKLPFQ